LEEDLNDLFENAPCGYLSMMPDGRILKANATLASWVERKSGQVVGRRLHDLLTIGSRIFYETHHAPLLALQGHFHDASLDLKLSNGDKLPVSASASECRDASGALLFTRVAFFRSGDRRRYERQLVAERAAAAAARDESQHLEAVTQNLLRLERENATLREQFIAVLGHDLRNPLSSIAGGAQLLSRDPQSDRGQRILTMIQASVGRMAGLIDNVMDFARGRLGSGIGLNSEPVELAPVLQQVVDELRIGVPDHTIETDFALAEPIVCDASRIGQMVSNLLGNALTHGAADRPVRIHGTTNPGELVIWVANDGRPIPPAAMERLFHPFFRGEVRASQQGLGLGLHIASEIARAHGATLSVDSSEEETRFTFRMPRG
jgi:sigma-B regulation protein RsbU (phosphoserine phosphatase)